MRTTVWNEEIADHTARLLFETGSYLVDFNRPKENWFLWKSGIRAPCYCNCRYLNRSYEAYEAATAYIETTVRLRFQEVQLIVGLASAGVSWAARISSRLRLPMSFVRTVQKKYGIGKLVEGNPENNAKAVIIDDLCGGGDTIFNAIEALKSEYQVQTLGVVTITNWCFKHMWERFDPINVKVHSLTSYPHILRIGVRTGRLTEEQAAMLREFYRAPLTYDWPQISKDNQKP